MVACLLCDRMQAVCCVHVSACEPFRCPQVGCWTAVQAACWGCGCGVCLACGCDAVRVLVMPGSVNKVCLQGVCWTRDRLAG